MHLSKALLLGMIILASQQSAAQQSPQQRISLLTYQAAHQPSDLNCTLTRRGTGYINYDYAWATLASSTDATPVFAHEEAFFEVFDSDDRGEAAILCTRVREVKEAAIANGEPINVVKTVELSVVVAPSYGAEGCQRYLVENVTVQVAPGVVLASNASKPISTTPADCRSEK